MPPDRGRASKACTSCRKQKTRCYESGISGGPCLRCERLRQSCSFAQDALEEQAESESTTGSRLERLEKVVAHLLDRLGEDPSQILDERPTDKGVRGPEGAEAGDSVSKSVDASSAPVLVIRELAADTGIEQPMSPQPVSLDGLVPPELALHLISIFQENYGRWVLFNPSEDPHSLLGQTRKSPLLFSACCLIAVRHTSQELAATLAPKLYECARSLVQSALLVSPQPLEFFQAALVLCMWSTTVGQVPLSIDSWLLSGFTLQHCQSSPLFSTVINPTSSAVGISRDVVNRWFLWNHICLVHLHYCVGTSRRSMLQEWHLARCRAIVASDWTTYYELRMVAEIYLYRTVYEHLSGTVDIPQSVAALQAWRKEWQFVLERPRAQFLMMGFHFSHLLLYDRCLKAKSARSQESVVSEMISHATNIIQLAMDTVDERTRHLSDHIYHMITFAAITICRLIGNLEDQQGTIQDVTHLNSLINDLVQWLQSIGLPCHAAHTFGTIITQVQRRMCPQVGTTIPNPAPADDILDEDFTRLYFPEFLGVAATPNGGWDATTGFTFFSHGLPPGEIN
ncbi:Zn(II)2Cys6 transcription factor [Aspergillus lucknowensis]|uniref:Transcriptional activator of proteases prtT n=1 Tax=Aspergillus lucknowensis TaxID=176173 RepID=A0ABR4M320_9EURO